MLGVTVALMLVGAGAQPSHGAGFGDSFLVSNPLVDGTGSDAGGTVVADQEGNFTYAWVERETDDLRVLETRVVSADGSKGPVNVIATADGSGPANDYFNDFDLSTGPEGSTHMAWSRVTQTCTPGCVSSFVIEYLNLDETGAAIGNPDTVHSSTSARTPVGPVLATSGTGRTGVLFGEFDGFGATDVLMAIAQDDNDPLLPFELSEDNWSGVQYLDIAASPNGTLFPVWSGYHGPDIAAHGRFVTDDGTITAERELMIGQSYLEDVEAQIDQSGRGSVFATDYDGNSLLKFRQVAPNGDLVQLGPTRASFNIPSDAEVGDPYTAVTSDGTVLFAFAQTQPPALRKNVWTGTISPSGVPANPKQFTAPIDDVGVSSPSIAMGPEDTGFLTWLETPETPPDDVNYLYRGQSMTADGSAAGATRTLRTLSRSPEVFPRRLDAAFSSDGNGVALWEEENQVFSYAQNLHSAIFDASAPEVELWVPAAATIGQEIVMAVEATDNAPLDYSWKVDGTTLPGTGTTARFSFSSVATSTVEVTVTDQVGNSMTESGQVVVSGPPAPPVPPNTTITGKPGKKTKSRAATFKFISSLAGSKFECRLDKAGWSDCKSPKKPTKLKAGKHTFRVRAIKGDLIDQAPASYSWTVKKTKKKKRN